MLARHGHDCLRRQIECNNRKPGCRRNQSTAQTKAKVKPPSLDHRGSLLGTLAVVHRWRRHLVLDERQSHGGGNAGCGRRKNGRGRPADEPLAPAPKAHAQEGVPAGLYGDQGGEQILPADPGKPDTLLRCRATDTFFKLSNPHVGTDRFGRPTLFIDYEKVRVGNGGFTLVIHSGDGSRTNVLLLGPLHQTRGTLEITSMFGGFGAFGRPAFPQNMEAYLVVSDGRYGPNTPQFKVSNSVVLGTMPGLTRPRNWTQEEIARLTKPPPNYTNANGHPNVGEDTPFAGNAKGGGSFQDAGGRRPAGDWHPLPSGGDSGWDCPRASPASERKE
jgi:hypothetical protein